jgi:hypothetical protein
MDDRFKSLLDTEWRKRQPRQNVSPGSAAGPTWPSWHYELTPPLPGEWPPTPRTAAYYYAYATGRSISLADATYVAAPWARIRLDRHGTVAFESLSAEIREIGIQGMGPLDEEGRAAWDLSESAQERLISLCALPKGEEAAQIRTFYEVWVNGNGQIVDALRPYHAKFFQWLSGSLWSRVSSRIGRLGFGGISSR